MFALAAVALGLGLALALTVAVVLRSDGVDRRLAFVTLAVAVAAGGVAGQVAPVPDRGGIETPDTAGPAPTPDTEAVLEPEQGIEPTAVGTAPAVETATNRRLDPTTVVDVLAGDLIVYRTATGGRRTARLAGVDAPGIDGADPARFDGVLTGSRGQACLAAHGRQAVRSLRAHVANETVTVRQASDGPGLPHVVVRVEGASASVNHRLVSGGLARSVDGRYADAEGAARSGHLGLWSCGVVRATPPLRDDGQPELRIAAVHPNPPGPDADALTEEYVVVRNTGPETVDLGGWYLRVEGGPIYFFEEHELKPGAELVVHAGSGRDTDTDVYWGVGRPVLDNDHDTLTLVDGTANRTARFSY
jgi:micrococcal nuclease